MSMKRFLAITLVAASATGCLASGGPTVAPHVTPDQQRSASTSMGISFPPETRFLLYHRSSEALSLLPVPDDCVHLKLEFPAAVAKKMLEETHFALAKWETAQRYIHDVPDWSEWKPSQVKKFRSTQIELPKGRYLDVLMDHDGDEKVVAYLVWFET
jgi:hypothetical protein